LLFHALGGAALITGHTRRAEALNHLGWQRTVSESARAIYAE